MKHLTRIAWLTAILLAGISILIGIGGIIWSLWLFHHGYNPWEHYAIGVTALLIGGILWHYTGADL